jgi:hypothetical protein
VTAEITRSAPASARASEGAGSTFAAPRRIREQDVVGRDRKPAECCEVGSQNAAGLAESDQRDPLEADAHYG